MVSWFVTNPVPSGLAAGFYRQAGSGVTPTRAVYSGYAYPFASPGTVDANFVTRYQYAVPGGLADVGALANLRFDQADVNSLGGSGVLTGTMFLAPASAFSPGAVPNPSDIRNAATIVIRGRSASGGNGWINVPGDLGLTIFRDGVFSWEPNKKWWMLVAPTKVTSYSSTPSIANDVPVGDINANGRAMSFWTNRTPLAPTISVPATSIIAAPGTVLDFELTANDPDRLISFPGDQDPTAFADVAGVQVQVRRKPTVDNPDPAWGDLPLANSAGTGYTPSWFIDRSQQSLGNTGAEMLWKTMKMKIRCASTTQLISNQGYLAAGDWQIRARTFDYGHPFPNISGGYAGYAPLVDTKGSYSADNYPATNTSPWSAIREVSITTQVPKPIPISPANNRAFLEDQTLTLAWQYRNTYNPPSPQSGYSVQVKRVKDAEWKTLRTNLASGASQYVVGSADAFAFDPVSGNQYEWRVKTFDGWGAESEWSDPARFWIVPPPDSGQIMPSPADLIDGATLGCGTHIVEIFRRGGRVKTGTLTGIERLEWSRVRDDISTAKITVKNWGVDCGEMLADLQSWAYEVVIFRDNGYSIDRVWEGPITLLTYEADTITIHAKDVMAFLYRRIIRQAMSDAGKSPTAGRTVVQRAAEVIQNCMAPDDPNVLQYLQVLTGTNDAKQYRSTPAFARTGFEEVDDMASNAGLDYTAVGRAILVWGTKHRIGTLPELRDEDLGASPIVSEYGMSMSNRYAISDGSGTYGEADRLNDEDEDPTYGLVEMLSSTWASEAEGESGTYTEEGLATVRESFAESAERSIADRYPPPVVVRVPDNTRLNASTVLSIQHLVPGVVIPLRSTSTLRSVKADQKLDSIKVTEVKGEETITVTMSPFSREDTASEEGGE